MRRHSATAKVLLAFFSAFACLTAIELSLRFSAHANSIGVLTSSFDPNIPIPRNGNAQLGHLIRLSENRKIVYELKPNLSVRFAGALMTTNPMGFRGQGTPKELTDDAFRIVGIGDSSMFGRGIPDDATYLSVLTRLISDRFSEKRVEIVNTAVPGYNTVMEVETLKTKGMALQPHLVIIEFVSNDLSLPTFMRRKPDVLKLDESFLVMFFSRRWLRYESPNAAWKQLATFGVERIPHNQRDGFGHEIDPLKVPEEYRSLVGWGAYRNAMLSLRCLSEERGFRVLAMTLGPYPLERKLRALAIAKSLGFSVLDMGPRYLKIIENAGLRDIRETGLAVSKTDAHPSATAHAIAAEAILELMIEEEWLL